MIWPVQKANYETEKKMADNDTQVVEETGEVDAIDQINKAMEETNKKLDEVSKELEEAKQARINHPGFSIRKGEDVMSSRGYSIQRLAMAMHSPTYADEAKIELDLAKRLLPYCRNQGYTPGKNSVYVPLSTAHMPTTDIKDEGGNVHPAFPVSLVKECGDLFSGTGAIDVDELDFVSKNMTFAQKALLRKDLSAFTDTSGGTLVALPAQGQLIDLLRATEVFARAGAQEVTLPPQGSIRFPRDTGDPTVAGFAEGGTITESTPTTGELTLNAKKYAGLVDIPVEMLRFSSVSIEGWLRRKFAARLGLTPDSDMIDGVGSSTTIKGCVTYSAINTQTATTAGANGDTLGPNDPAFLQAEILNSNAREGLGGFFAMTPRMWSRLTHRRADAVSASDAAGPYVFRTTFANAVGGMSTPHMLEGWPVILSTNVPQDRLEGSATTLTMILAGIGPSWIIGRAGVIEFDMTDSDASKFASGINTMRAIMFIDAGPEHEDEFGFTDQLLETT